MTEREFLEQLRALGEGVVPPMSAALSGAVDRVARPRPRVGPLLVAAAVVALALTTAGVAGPRSTGRLVDHVVHLVRAVNLAPGPRHHRPSAPVSPPRRPVGHPAAVGRPTAPARSTASRRSAPPTRTAVTRPVGAAPARPTTSATPPTHATVRTATPTARPTAPATAVIHSPPAGTEQHGPGPR